MSALKFAQAPAQRHDVDYDYFAEDTNTISKTFGAFQSQQVWEAKQVRSPPWKASLSEFIFECLLAAKNSHSAALFRSESRNGEHFGTPSTGRRLMS